MASLPEIAPMSTARTRGVIFLFHLGRGSHFHFPIPSIHNNGDYIFIPSSALVTGAVYYILHQL
jgi:hypothetical protein